MRPTVLRWLALLAALVVALPFIASAQPHYFCRAMDRVVSARCCENDEKHEVGAASARAADCCERISAARHGALALRIEAVNHISGPALLATLPRVELPARRATDCSTPVPHAQGPPTERVPLFLKNCSLLT